MPGKTYRLVTFVVLLTMLLSACAGAGQSGGQGNAPALNGTKWVLATMNGEKPIEGSTITLDFEADKYGGRSGCNSYGGDYSVGSDGKLTVGPGVMTEMACDPAAIMQQETAYLNLLPQAASAQINGDQLEIKNADGETILVFTKA